MQFLTIRSSRLSVCASLYAPPPTSSARAPTPAPRPGAPPIAPPTAPRAAPRARPCRHHPVRTPGPRYCITHVRMPGMTGLELHKRLVRSGKLIPTILIPPFPDERDRARALRSGGVGYLGKPFDEDNLLACIQSALQSRNTGKRES